MNIPEILRRLGLLQSPPDIAETISSFQERRIRVAMMVKAWDDLPRRQPTPEAAEPVAMRCTNGAVDEVHLLPLKGPHATDERMRETGWTLTPLFAHPPKPEPTEARELNLKWGRHDGRGEYHIEWHAPCGCAYHPEPKPHVHPCIKHSPIEEAPQPPAEWMAALAQVIESDAKEWDGLDRALIQGRIRNFVAQHAPKVPEGGK